MSCIKVPITKTDKGGFQITIDLNSYSEKAITATIYRYTDKFFVYQNTMPSDDKQVCVTITDFTLHFSCCFTKLLHSLFITLLNNFTM